MLDTRASTELRNCSPSPIDRASYQRYASVTSASASGENRNSAAMAAGPLLDFIPGKSRPRVLLEPRSTPFEFCALPLVHRYGAWVGRQIVPQILHQLQLLGRTQIEDRHRWIHTAFTVIVAKSARLSHPGRHHKAQSPSRGSPEMIQPYLECRLPSRWRIGAVPSLLDRTQVPRL